MKKVAKPLWAVVLTVGLIFCFSIIAPQQAQAVPPLNPLCWIADQNNPGVKAGCKSHDWSWPHWGGGSKSDGFERGCGGSTITSQAWWMTASELRATSNSNYTARKGLARKQLVLTESRHYNVWFWPDYMVYTWQSQTEYWVDYGDGTFKPDWTIYSKSKGGKTTVTCNMKGKVK